jgi:methionine synthase I (cobalamin-dependent)
MELMTLNGLVSPQRVVTGGFLNATLSTSGGMICGSVVGDFQALIHVHVSASKLSTAGINCAYGHPSLLVYIW